MEIIYSPSLILLSIAVAIFASFVALNLAHTITQAQGKTKLIWLLCGSVAMGVGIWSMHFVGMLAMEMPDMEMAYDIPLMILSVVVAILASLLALYIVSRNIVSRKSMALGGLALAFAISGMHYIGMFSMRMTARIEWNYYLVALSIVIALVASFAALTIAFRLRNKPERFMQLTLASILMGVAIAGMHYVGILAATFIHDSTLQIEDTDLLVTSGLSLATISTTLLILGIALISSVGQRVLIIRQNRSEEILSKSEMKYKILVEAVKDYGIFMLDPKGYITTWNLGAQRISGYTDGEIIGKHVSTLYPKENLSSDMPTTEFTIAENIGHFEGEAIRQRKDGTTFWANIVLDPLFDKEGQLTGFSKVIRDITQLKVSERKSRSINEELEKRVAERTLALQKSETQLRTIANAIPILMAQIDTNQQILFANDYFCDWFMCPPDQITEKTFEDLLGDEIYLPNKIYIDKALAGETVTYERLSHSGLRSADLNITLVPEFDKDHHVKSIIILAADVSNYKKIEAELKQAKEQAEVANETKSAFLANMSHEIRTPLGAVLGFSELLLDEDMPMVERQRYVEIIKRNGKLLSNIINDILDLSKVEAGKLELEKTDIQLLELVNEIAVLLNLEANGKGIRLNVSTEGVIPHTIKTDSTRLRQILFNIVGNAIKFTEKGFVNLKIQLDSSDISKIAFVVQDSGAGISPSQAERLFSPFTQADATTTRKYGGTGLGLALSKKLAKALGGDVVLTESELGKGSTFTITIDHGQSKQVFIDSGTPPATKDLEISDNRPSGLSNFNILVVDDSLDNLALITSILNFAGASVETARNGREGVHKALEGNFNMILMDLQMPEMDGHEATRTLRQKGFERPIIALTAHAMKEERKRCLENGFNDHLTKPIDRRTLLQALAEYQYS